LVRATSEKRLVVHERRARCRLDQNISDLVGGEIRLSGEKAPSVPNIAFEEKIASPGAVSSGFLRPSRVGARPLKSEKVNLPELVFKQLPTTMVRRPVDGVVSVIVVASSKCLAAKRERS